MFENEKKTLFLHKKKRWIEFTREELFALNQTGLRKNIL